MFRVSYWSDKQIKLTDSIKFDYDVSHYEKNFVMESIQSLIA